jgi:hypothetical protein
MLQEQKLRRQPSRCITIRGVAWLSGWHVCLLQGRSSSLNPGRASGGNFSSSFRNYKKHKKLQETLRERRTSHVLKRPRKVPSHGLVLFQGTDHHTLHLTSAVRDERT